MKIHAVLRKDKGGVRATVDGVEYAVKGGRSDSVLALVAAFPHESS